MKAPDIIANMSRGWNRNPAGVAAGTERTGMSAALWTSYHNGVQEVWANPDPKRHIVSVPQITVAAEMFLDGKSVWTLNSWMRSLLGSTRTGAHKSASSLPHV